MKPRRNKPYNPASLLRRLQARMYRTDMASRVDAVFRPLEAVLAEIERTGFVDADRGVPIFRNPVDGEEFELAPAVTGIAEMFEMWSIRHSTEAPIKPLRQLASRLGYSMPLDAQLLADVTASLPVLRKIAMQMGPREAADLVLQTQILDAQATQ